MIQATNTIRNNYFIGGYGSDWPIDHDDGSSEYIDSGNVIAYGGSKVLIHS